MSSKILARLLPVPKALTEKNIPKRTEAKTNMTIIVIMYFFYLLSKLFSINNAENDKKYRCLSDFSLNEALCVV